MSMVYCGSHSRTMRENHICAADRGLLPPPRPSQYDRAIEKEAHAVKVISAREKYLKSHPKRETTEEWAARVKLMHASGLL